MLRHVLLTHFDYFYIPTPNIDNNYNKFPQLHGTFITIITISTIIIMITIITMIAIIIMITIIIRLIAFNSNRPLPDPHIDNFISERM